MKIKNETNYDTRFLHRLFMACEKHEGTRGKGREVKVKKKRGGGVAGCAWLYSRIVTMKLPSYQPHARIVGQVYIHEVGHNLGLRHKDMPSCNFDMSWLPDELDCELPLKPAKPPKPKLNIVEVRAAKAQKKLDDWTKKLKRAKTFVKKYRKRVRYYKKKRAASP